MPTLVIKSPDGGLQEQEIGVELTVGRANESGLVLSEGGVSRKHARFWVEDETVWLEDLGSANGTWIDGRRLDAPTRVGSKSEISIGDYSLQLKVGRRTFQATTKRKLSAERASTSTVNALSRPPSAKLTRAIPKGTALAKRSVPRQGARRGAAGLRLVGLSGDTKGKEFPLHGTMLVGRVAAVDIELDDDSVSRRHAEVTVSGGRVTVRDLESANGTAVNGTPISNETPLESDDIVQFGSVELRFESPAIPLSVRPMLRNTGAASSAAPPEPPQQKLKMVLVGAVALLAIAVAVLMAFSGGTSSADISRMAVPLEKSDNLESWLAECRTFSSAAQGLVPNWKRATVACERVLDVEPLHSEAKNLMRRIHRLEGCQEALEEGRQKIGLGQTEAGLGALERVGKDCEEYLLAGLGLAQETWGEVKKRAGQECRAYAASDKWELALRRCESYARLACQTMTAEELHPPVGRRVVLDGRLNPKTDWRPSDALYGLFLKARQKQKRDTEPWTCPDIAVLHVPPPPPDPSKRVREELRQRYAEPELGRALVLYFDGQYSEAPVVLQRVLTSMGKASAHETARALLGQMNQAINFQESGIAEITNDKPERAAAFFRKALELDERLVLGETTGGTSDAPKREMDFRVSILRKTIINAMSAKSYQKGAALAERKDFRAACMVWKLGLQFSRSNTDLNRAVTNVCTPNVVKALAEEPTCQSLKSALDFAVEGEPLEERLRKALTDNGCS